MIPTQIQNKPPTAKLIQKRLLSVFVVIWVTIIGVFTPFKPVFAIALTPIALGALTFIGGILTKATGKVSTAILAVEGYLWAGIFISTGLASIAWGFLMWVLEPDFIKLKYTDPAGNPIIKNGLEITQNLVNMALLVVIIYAALVIALRLTQETEAKKMLAKFILVALLVNFAPVLCGLVVDATNIVMNLFIKPVREAPLAIAGAWEATKAAVAELGLVIGMEGVKFRGVEFALAVWVILFNFLLALVLFAFAGILVLRHLAIWVLVIFAPLAFVCYILPQTQKYWKLWLENFLKWAFIGVPTAFFLYLAFYFTNIIDTVIVAKSTGFGESIDMLLIYSVPLVFFYLALRMVTQSTAWGAAMIMGFGSALLKRGIQWGRGKGLPALRMGVRYARRRALATPAGEAITRRLETAPLLGRVIGGPGATLRRREERLEEARKELEKIPDTPEGNADLIRIMNMRAVTPEGRERRMFAIETLAKRGALTNEVVRHLPQFQREGGNIWTVLKARPDWAGQFIDSTTGKPITVKDVLAKMTPTTFVESVQKEALASRATSFRVAQNKRLVERLGLHGKTATKKQFKDTIISLYADPKTLPRVKEQLKYLINDKFITDANWQF